MSDQLNLLYAVINDAIRLSQQKGVPKFVGFLDATEVSAAKMYLAKMSVNLMFYGGGDDNERMMVGFFPDWTEADKSSFPIVSLHINNKSKNAFSHRDVLGAVMSCGIERDFVGDILFSGLDAYVFVNCSVRDHLINELQKIRNSGVFVTEEAPTQCLERAKFLELSDTVPSLRLDAVVASFVNTSRTKAVEFIEQGLVYVNSICCEKCTKLINENDVISVKGKGKFIVDNTDEISKKGRKILKYRKYI